MHETTQPRRYRIVVHGRLGEHLASAFEDLNLEAHPGETWLTGTFVDQAQLIGLLDWLRDLGISIVSVNPSTDAADASQRTHPDREFLP